MSQKPETVFKNRLVPKLSKLPGTYLVKVQQVAKIGTPDILMCISGVFVAIELKSSKKGIVSALQDYNLNQIYDAGGITILAYPENEVKVLSFLTNLAHSAAKDSTKKERIQ
jgi:hypothetical protein